MAEETPDKKRPTAQVLHLVGVRKDGFDSAFGYDDTTGADPTQPNAYVPPNASRSVQSNVYEPEDEYQKLYTSGINSKGLLEPPFILRMLDRLCQENNALSPCVEAMVTNIEGTGYDFTPEARRAARHLRGREDRRAERVLRRALARRQLHRDAQERPPRHGAHRQRLPRIHPQRQGRDRLHASRGRQDDPHGQARRADCRPEDCDAEGRARSRSRPRSASAATRSC